MKFFFLIITFFICSCQAILDLDQSKQPVETNPIINPAVTKKTPLPQLYNDDQGDFIILKHGEHGFAILENTTTQETKTIDLFDSQYLGISLSSLGDKIALWFDGHIYIVNISTYETSKVESKRFGSTQYGQLTWINNDSQIATDCFPSDRSLISEVCVADIATGEIKTLTDLTEFTTTFLSGAAIGGWSDQTNTLVFNLNIMPETSGYVKSLIF